MDEFVGAARGLGRDPNAEAVLLRLRASPGGVATALTVLRAPRRAGEDADVIDAHAALLLRDAGLRHMAAEPELRECALALALERPVRGAGDVLLGTVAALLKRAFVDPGTGEVTPAGAVALEGLLGSVREMLARPDRELHGARLLFHLVSEFSASSRSTALGMAVEYHVKCVRCFTRTGLRECFSVAIHSLASPPLSPLTLLTLCDALDVILTWPFDEFAERSSSSATSSLMQYSRLMGNTPMDYRSAEHQMRTSARKIHPGRGWSELLTGNGFACIRALVFVLQQQQQQHSVQSKIRQLLLQLACLSGDVFATEDVMVRHALAIAEVGYGVCQDTFRPDGGFWEFIVHTGDGGVSPISNRHGDDSPLAMQAMDGCSIVARALCSPSSPDMMFSCEPNIVSQFSQLTHFICQACGECGVDFERTFLADCLLNVLNVWVLWVSFAVSNPHANILSAASEVFVKCVDAKLKSCVTYTSHHIQDQDDDDDEDSAAGGNDWAQEFVDDLSCLARANPQFSLTYLNSAIQACYLPGEQQQQQQAILRAEKIGFLVDLTSHVLADPFDRGEIPMIPQKIHEYSHQFNNNNDASSRDGVVAISMTLLDILRREMPTTLAGRSNSSPLLSRKLLAAATRWCGTYLFPVKTMYNNTQSSYGSDLHLSHTIEKAFAGEGGSRVLDFLAQEACAYLTVFGDDESVARQAIALLRALSKNKSQLVHSHQWVQMCMANVSSCQHAQWQPLRQLTATVHGELVHVLVFSCTLGSDAERFCLMPAKTRLEGVLAAGLGAHSAAVHDAIRVVELFRGCVTSASMGDVSEHLRAFMTQSCLRELVVLAEHAVRVYDAGGEAMLHGVMKMFSEFCDVQLMFAASAHLPTIFTCAKMLVDAFLAVHAKRKLQGANEEEMATRADALRDVLRLLLSLTQRNALDFSNNNNNDEIVAKGAEVDASGVVLSCIDAVLPLVDMEMLHFAPVVEAYFDLVSTLCTTRAQYVCSLPDGLFHSILRSLVFGCDYHDAKVQRWSFDSLTAIAKAYGDGGNTSASYFVLDLASKLLELVLASTDVSALDAAALTLMALFALHQHAFLKAMEVTLQKVSQNASPTTSSPPTETQRLEQLKGTLRQCFERLFEGVRMDRFPDRLERPDRKAFQQNVHRLAQLVRPFVFTR